MLLFFTAINFRRTSHPTAPCTELFDTPILSANSR
jgi:hypothetical protein